jgi:ribosomal protein S18 acetylase RimI-like enzyme
LLAATLFGFVELGLRWATLSVDLDNKPAVKLFKHAGFAATRRYVGFAKVVAAD